jgi:hypothetical protein
LLKSCGNTTRHGIIINKPWKSKSNLAIAALGTLAQAEENYAEARANLQTALEIYVEYQDEYWATVAREILESLPE